MEYKTKKCEVINRFETYEECAQYMMGIETQKRKTTASYPFETYFVKILRHHPVLYDEKHPEFGIEFPTKHAWSIVAGYMMMKIEEVQGIWATFQKFTSSGVQLYIDLVNYVKSGDGNGWIDEDSDSPDEHLSDSASNSAIKQEDSFHVKDEIE